MKVLRYFSDKGAKWQDLPEQDGMLHGGDRVWVVKDAKPCYLKKEQLGGLRTVKIPFYIIKEGKLVPEPEFNDVDTGNLTPRFLKNCTEMRFIQAILHPMRRESGGKKAGLLIAGIAIGAMITFAYFYMTKGGGV